MYYVYLFIFGFMQPVADMEMQPFIDRKVQYKMLN